MQHKQLLDIISNTIFKLVYMDSVELGQTESILGICSELEQSSKSAFCYNLCVGPQKS